MLINNRFLPFAGLILLLIFVASPQALANPAKIVEGTITDIFNDEEAGEAYVSIDTKDGAFVIDCKHKGFDTPIAPGDYVKVSVKNVRLMMKKPVGDFVSALKHTPTKR